MSQPKIVGYMKPSCGWSRGVRAVFDKYGLEYDDLDIINNPDNFQEMVEKTGQPLQPCIQIDDVMLVDVSGDEVEAYLLQEKIVAPNDTAVGVATDSSCTEEEHAAMRQAAETSWTTFSN
ncbi:glutaredoxin [Candidatus Poribacteria bacterium]|nr:glutaredoxin [Candidatus Poribacteria bacterium]OUT58059.1 MAG: glutaredoxin [bacterium TMED15]